MWQWMPDMWTNLYDWTHGTHVHIFESSQFEGPYVGDLTVYDLLIFSPIL